MDKFFFFFSSFPHSALRLPIFRHGENSAPPQQELNEDDTLGWQPVNSLLLELPPPTLRLAAWSSSYRTEGGREERAAALVVVAGSWSGRRCWCGALGGKRLPVPAHLVAYCAPALQSGFMRTSRLTGRLEPGSLLLSSITVTCVAGGGEERSAAAATPRSWPG